jgi:hypothetical protein
MPVKNAYCFDNMKALEIPHIMKELDLVRGLPHTYMNAKSYHMSLYLKHVMAYFSQSWKYEKLESTVNTFTYGDRKYYKYTVHCTLSSEMDNMQFSLH